MQAIDYSETMRLVLQHFEYISLPQDVYDAVHTHLLAAQKKQGEHKHSELLRMVRFKRDNLLDVTAQPMSGGTPIQVSSSAHKSVSELRRAIAKHLSIPSGKGFDIILGTSILSKRSSTLASVGMHPQNCSLNLVFTEPRWAQILFPALYFHRRFDLLTHLYGKKHRNFDHIASHFGCLVQLRGIGSSILERNTWKELQKPLRLWIQELQEGELEIGIRAVQDLLETVDESHRGFCRRQHLPLLHGNMPIAVGHGPREGLACLQRAGIRNAKLWSGSIRSFRRRRILSILVKAKRKNMFRGNSN